MLSPGNHLLLSLFCISDTDHAPLNPFRGWSGGAKVLGKLSVPGRPTIWMIEGKGPIALAVDAGGVVWTFLSPLSFLSSFSLLRWSGGAKVLGKLPVPGVLLIWMIVGQGPIALVVGAGGGLFGHFFSHLSFLFSFSLSLGDGPI